MCVEFDGQLLLLRHERRHGAKRALAQYSLDLRNVRFPVVGFAEREYRHVVPSFAAYSFGLNQRMVVPLGRELCERHFIYRFKRYVGVELRLSRRCLQLIRLFRRLEYREHDGRRRYTFLYDLRSYLARWKNSVHD